MYIAFYIKLFISESTSESKFSVRVILQLIQQYSYGCSSSWIFQSIPVLQVWMLDSWVKFFGICILVYLGFVCTSYTLITLLLEHVLILLSLNRLISWVETSISWLVISTKYFHTKSSKRFSYLLGFCQWRGMEKSAAHQNQKLNKPNTGTLEAEHKQDFYVRTSHVQDECDSMLISPRVNSEI